VVDVLVVFMNTSMAFEIEMDIRLHMPMMLMVMSSRVCRTDHQANHF
jgi:hypothetical protein